MAFSVIIPARYHSKRLMKKLLLDLAGKTVLERTYLNAKRSKASRIVIATDSNKIADVARAFGAEVLLTNEAHRSGSARVVEAVEQLNLADEHIVVNLQGDEPLLPSTLIARAADELSTNDAAVATLCEPITAVADYYDENCVKVVFDKKQQALYFSRAPIPYFVKQKADSLKNCYRHIGLYAYRVGFLKQYKNLKKSVYEQAERLEQLSILYAGYRIRIGIVDSKGSFSIDTEADLQKARAFLK